MKKKKGPFIVSNDTDYRPCVFCSLCITVTSDTVLKAIENAWK